MNINTIIFASICIATLQLEGSHKQTNNIKTYIPVLKKSDRYLNNTAPNSMRKKQFSKNKTLSIKSEYAILKQTINDQLSNLYRVTDVYRKLFFFQTFSNSLEQLKKLTSRPCESRISISYLYYFDIGKKIGKDLYISYCKELNKNIYQNKIIFKNADLEQKCVQQKNSLQAILLDMYNSGEFTLSFFKKLEEDTYNQFKDNKEKEFYSEYFETCNQLKNIVFPLYFDHEECVKYIRFTMQVEKLENLRLYLLNKCKITTLSLKKFIPIKNKIDKSLLLFRYFNVYRNMKHSQNLEKIKSTLMIKYNIMQKNLDILEQYKTNLHNKIYFLSGFYSYLDTLE